jgi:hypothetical protein
MLVGIWPDFLAEETASPSARGETGLDFACWIVTASVGLFLHLVLSVDPKTGCARRVRGASLGMGFGRADIGPSCCFSVAGKFLRPAIG